MRLKDKVAVVTGSGRGIGRAIALRFAQEGAHVVVNYSRSADEANQVAAEIQKLGPKAIVVRADVSKVADIARLMDEAEKAFGRLDILVNNSGVEKDVPFEDVSEADYDWVMDVNLKGAFFAAQAFARHLVKDKRPGRIINISSVHEEIPFPGYTAYCCSKGGMKMLCRNLAVELGPKGITVNNIAPGATITEINRAMLANPAKKNALLAQIPMGRLGEVEDVSPVAVFLASDEASYVTASTYYVDGGLTWFYKE